MQGDGLHIIGDLWGCDLQALPTREAELSEFRERVSTIVRKNGLQELGNHYHLFGPHSLTACVTLAESHIAFHSWPERNYVSLDIFVCNYTQDNSAAARSI